MIMIFSSITSAGTPTGSANFYRSGGAVEPLCERERLA